MINPRTSDDIRTIQIPEIIPILPMFNILVFPKMLMPMEVFGDQSLQLVDEAMAKDRLIGLILAKKPPLEMNCRPEDFYSIGTVGIILKMAKGFEKRAQLLVQGVCRYRIIEFIEGQPYLQARIEPLEDQEIKDIEVEALMVNLTNLFDRVVKLTPFMPQEFAAMAKNITEPGVLADLVASIINVTTEEKQAVLEILNVKERLREVTRLVNHQIEILELGNKIQSQVKSDMEKSQREYFLRQQLNAIRKELGETEEARPDIEEYRKRLAEKDLPDEVRKEAERELNRLERMHPSSAEYTVSSTYLDWIIALPWREHTEDNLDIKKARFVLDEDHYGLEKPKKRIIEYLAVRKLKPDTKGPILCFVGPPGTGKTSLGQSIARALGRKFVRIALGGVRDEAEIRGHRRTYIGALPGRIIQGIRRAESNNPVFMLDEIDKVGSDFRGDPSSALLEVLDPAQNYSFVDHYLDLPFDLSHVMFITTANVLDTIPPALRDRLEIIELASYTSEEKLQIARRYLIPRQIRENGLTEERISFTNGAIKLIISGYTREAGVRGLEREIAAICRGVACAVAEGYTGKTVIRQKDVPRYLGPIRTFQETAIRTSKPGVVMGLAWTPTGGELLFVEATAMPGNKGLTMTGQLGDVMKESATAALSYIRSNADSLGIDKNFFDKLDIHIHVPSGAIPKDGPSAGVTILTALTSLLTNKTVKKNIAMTGEITLRGLVLPVGGIKEKVLAAHRAGVKTVILPKWNQKDLEDIPAKTKRDMEFIFVDDTMDVLRAAGLLAS
ncbi:MAG: endopeptidase La [Syntrophales bacterium]|nr:endopeptidase La [Syntrophales bacterium]